MLASSEFGEPSAYEGGFDFVLSVEHEDPVWGGTEERIETGLRVAHRTLRPLIVA